MTELAPSNDWPSPILLEFWDRQQNGHVGTRLLVETDRMRIWETRLQAGERIAFHRHVLNYCWTALSAGTSRSHAENGITRERTYKPGDSAYYEYGRGDFRFHDLENIGDTELVFAIVESLESPNPPLPL